MFNLSNAVRRILSPLGTDRFNGGSRAEYEAGVDVNGQLAAPMSIAAKGLIDDHGNVFASKQKTISGTTYTITQDDCGFVLEFTSNSAITVTISKRLAPQFSCGVTTEGTGAITFAAESGATVHSVGGSLATSDQYGFTTVRCRANSNGVSADVRLYGGLA